MSRNELTPAQRTLRLAVAAIAASFLTTWAFRTIEFRSECAEWLEEIHRLEHRAAAEDNPATEASPTETREGEDTSTKATRNEEDAGDGNHPEESPA